MTDVVYTIIDGRRSVTTWVRCTFCTGHKDGTSAFSKRTMVTGMDGQTTFCPICRGNGGKSVSLPGVEWQVYQKLTIGYVRLEFSLSEGLKESYMCEETGIGSGRVYRVHNLYPHRRAAQKECDKRNSL